YPSPGDASQKRRQPIASSHVSTAEDAMQPPQFPAGPFQSEEGLDARRRDQLIAEIEAAPRSLCDAVAGLSDGRVDPNYVNWTRRQIVHPRADSHVNSYVRFKWALTEDTPTIKAYHEGLWAGLEDSRTGDVGPPLALLNGLHRRWAQLLRAM